MLWLAVTVVSLLSPVFADNLASCANTLCTGTKVCRIIERCWGYDCQVGTACIEPQHLPMGAGSVCQYDNPLLHSQDGGALSEIQCGSASIGTECPTGTTCLEPPGVCCTGVMKESGSCLTKPGHYYLSRGSCKTFCRHDQECPGFQRCCDTGVGCNACMDPVPFSTCETHTCMPNYHCVMTETDCVEYPCFASPTCFMDKTGECPYLDQQVSCADQCQVDSHCPGDKKCCGAGGCKVCVSPGMSGPVTQPPPPNFNGGFDGLGGTGGAGDPFGSTEPNTTSGITDPSFPDMSGFLGGGGGAGGVGDTGSSSSPILSLDTSNSPSSSGTDGTTNPFGNMLGTLSNMQNGGSTGSTSMSSMLDTLSKMQSGGSTGSGSTSMSSMLGALSNMQSGGSTGSGPTSMSSMLGALNNMQSGGSTGSGLTSMSSMLSNVQNMMKQMSSGGGTSPTLSGTGSSSFNPMLANLNSINNDPPSASLSGLNSLSNLGPTGGGGGGLNPVLSGNTLQTLGSGGLAALGAGDSMPSSGLRPKLPSLGRPSIAMNQASRRRGRFNCGPWCMMMMVMGN